MTLIIAARCKDGAIAISDTRSLVKSGGKTSFHDDFEKSRIVRGYLVCNHGYNRIGDQDWKLSRSLLYPNETHPVYSTIASEMVAKVDKFAAYLFLKKDVFFEVEIHAGEKPIGTHRRNHDRIKCGSGGKYVELEALVDLSKKRMKEVKPTLIEMFNQAYARQQEDGGTFFSPTFTVTAVRG